MSDTACSSPLLSRQGTGGEAPASGHWLRDPDVSAPVLGNSAEDPLRGQHHERLSGGGVSYHSRKAPHIHSSTPGIKRREKEDGCEGRKGSRVCDLLCAVVISSFEVHWRKVVLVHGLGAGHGLEVFAKQDVPTKYQIHTIGLPSVCNVGECRCLILWQTGSMYLLGLQPLGVHRVT